MSRKILFGGTIIINDLKLTDKAIVIENQHIRAIGSLKEFIKTEPKNTVTDLINLDNGIIKIF